MAHLTKIKRKIFWEGHTTVPRSLPMGGDTLTAPPSSAVPPAPLHKILNTSLYARTPDDDLQTTWDCRSLERDFLVISTIISAGRRLCAGNVRQPYRGYRSFSI